MSIPGPVFFGNATRDIEALRRHWGWILALGIVLIVVGVLAVSSSVLFTMAYVLAIGVLLSIAGIVEGIQAFRQHASKGFALHLLTAVLSIVVGLLMIFYPLAGAAVLTMLVGSFLIVGGLFRSIAAAALQLPSWGWRVASGIVSLVLGVLIFAQWPYSSLWVIGLFVGVDMIVNGWSSVMLALQARRLPITGTTVTT